MKPALVVSGGGAKGAFAVGAIRYMCEELGLEFGQVAGTSTGALIAPLVALGDLPLLEKLYTSVRTRDLLAPASVQTTWSRGYLYDTKPFERMLARTIDADRARRILESEVPTYLSAVSLQSGRLAYFRAGAGTGVPDRNCDLIPIADRATLLTAMAASSNQPGYMPPVWYPPNQEPICEYVDGGVREYAPIGITIANGATEVYVVMHSAAPADRRPREGQMKGLPKVVARALELLIDEVGENDLHLSQLYSAATEYLDTIRRNARTMGLSPAQIDSLFDGDNPFEGRRAVTLHVIRPEAPLPTDGLTFEPKTMRMLLEWGRRRAQEVLS